MGKLWKRCQTLLFGAPKSLQMVITAVKLKDASPWKESYDQPRQHIEKQRYYFVSKGPSSQGYGFPSGHVWMGEGNGNPLQCSCLVNPRDRGAWWAAIYGVGTGSDTTEAT